MTHKKQAHAPVFCVKDPTKEKVLIVLRHRTTGSLRLVGKMQMKQRKHAFEKGRLIKKEEKSNNA